MLTQLIHSLRLRIKDRRAICIIQLSLELIFAYVLWAAQPFAAVPANIVEGCY